MNKRILLLSLLGTTGLVGASRHMGGWAVVTVDELPDYVVTGQPVRLSFVVRQHGMRPLDGLQPSVEARSAVADISANALPQHGSAGNGRYVATLDLSRPGDWTVTIHSGFGNSQATLLPIRAVPPGAARPPSLSDAERGRRLFIAKGCFTCHVNTEVTAAPSLSIGPDLTGRRYPPGPLASFLAHPDSLRLTNLPRSGELRMPNLGLSEREIASLVAMINGGREVSAR